jgi:hypothetical protein
MQHAYMQVMPEFLQVEAFTKLSSAIVRVGFIDGYHLFFNVNCVFL